MRRTIAFLFGDEYRTLEGVDPTLTILDWLRLEERRTGTKEGCAEGDCGACTVVVGRPVGGALRYEAVNACIRFLPTLDGCHLLVVEHLASGGAPHPAQQALVELHGSQCGFCTPGFVMSLFALWLNDGTPGDERIEVALQGNLCRCTGYAPIVAAGRRMGEASEAARAAFAKVAAAAYERLAPTRDGATIALDHRGRRFLAPATADALAELCLAHPEATIVAGATDVGLWVTKFMRELPVVIHLGRVAELRRIEDSAGAITIGAGVTYTDARGALGAAFPDFGELIRRIGGEQVRNQGTIGGNIANGSPIGDTPPALIALGATLNLRRGEARRALPLEAFFLDYGAQDRAAGEFVESVTVPKLRPGARFRAYKVSKRFDEDITAVLGCFLLEPGPDGTIASARVAFGGMAATPRRAPGAEAALRGRPWTLASFEAAAAALARDFSPIDDWRASADYRRRVAGNLLSRLYHETSGEGVETRLVGDRSLAHA